MLQEMSLQLWAMANELRGNMELSESRNYILGSMFYRYLSEHVERYCQETNLFEPEAGVTWNELFAEVASDPECRKEYLEDICSELGQLMLPEQTWACLV